LFNPLPLKWRQIARDAQYSKLFFSLNIQVEAIDQLATDRFECHERIGFVEYQEIGTGQVEDFLEVADDAT
jgi:hypothetical protein